MKFKEYLAESEKLPKPNVRNPKDFIKKIQKAKEKEPTVLYIKFDGGSLGKDFGKNDLYVTFIKKKKPEYYEIEYRDSIEDDDGEKYVATISGDSNFQGDLMDMRDDLKDMYGIDIGRL